MQTPALQSPPAHGLRSKPAVPAGFARPKGSFAEELPLPDGPPLRRLTSRQLRELSAQWHDQARRGDEGAERVAQVLAWVADQRARREPARVKVLAERLSRWVGL
ncbi:hypothetical protein [Variovorax sp.]|uniref:hypothetical protein n=1 Tax=Variovorax sp. TaxID=1871043 RepID=UPI002D571852|nr:hypothetical protein [Variovorax sp.]HYP85480.1 hypothetical protein [Variovorax sp.]